MVVPGCEQSEIEETLERIKGHAGVEELILARKRLHEIEHAIKQVSDELLMPAFLACPEQPRL